MDVEKWTRHFRLMADGKVHPDLRGKYVLGVGQMGGATDSVPPIKFVTPLAAAVERAKSELSEDRKVYKGKSAPARKGKRKARKSSSKKGKRTAPKGKKVYKRKPKKSYKKKVAPKKTKKSCPVDRLY